MDDEIWTTRDGRKIAVSDMTESHAKNALRMLLRNQRRRLVAEFVNKEVWSPTYEDEAQDFLSEEAYRDLANPSIFFPLLDGGVYGSPALQKKYGR